MTWFRRMRLFLAALGGSAFALLGVYQLSGTSAAERQTNLAFAEDSNPESASAALCLNEEEPETYFVSCGGFF